MKIRSPKDLHYPITVSKLCKQPGDAIDRFETLFEYTYRSTFTEVDKYGDEETVTRTLRTEFQSENEGALLSWSIGEGDVIDKQG
jgi:RNA polymerase II subunit A C-terminal domain phosphatase